MDLPSFEFGMVHLKFMGFQYGSLKIEVLTVLNQPRLQGVCSLAQLYTGGKVFNSSSWVKG
jgi:hypothetical protein